MGGGPADVAVDGWVMGWGSGDWYGSWFLQECAVRRVSVGSGLGGSGVLVRTGVLRRGGWSSGGEGELHWWGATFHSM